MARNWKDVRSDAVAAGQIDEKRVKAVRAALESDVRSYRLAEVRRSQNITQKDMAEAMKVSQPRVSKIERGDLDHTELSTLRSYVEALGGTLRVVADFGDQTLLVS